MADKVVYIAFYCKMFQGIKKIIFTKTNFGSMSYSVLFSLGIGLLSPEFFSIVPGKGLCEGQRTTATRNLTCKREHLFLCIFTSTPVNRYLLHSAVKLPLVKFISYKNHGWQEKSL